MKKEVSSEAEAVRLLVDWLRIYGTDTRLSNETREFVNTPHALKLREESQ